MAGINETRDWTEQVYQLETTDPVLGGPEGPSNLPHRHLANRTLWLRDKVMSETLSLAIPDDDGDVHHMVWIPRFRIPANFLGSGMPPADLRCGGFLLDKYQSSFLSYVGGVLKPASLPFQAPDAFLTYQDAKKACARRVFRGRPCHLMTMDEWGDLMWLVRLLGHELHGNQDGLRDARDPDLWEYYAEAGDTSLFIPGTGPLSWYHQGLPSGVTDLISSYQHMLDIDSYSVGTLTRRHHATLVNPIGANDESFEIEDKNGYHRPFLGFEHWPENDGLVALDAGSAYELAVYGQLVRTPNQPYRATLINVQRGRYGFDPAPHNAGVSCDNKVHHCLIPGGYTAIVDDDGLNNTNPGQATFAWSWGIYRHGYRDAAPSVGDIIAVHTEDLRVDAINGSFLTVTRGYNNTPIIAHPRNSPFASYSAAMVRVEQGRQVGTVAGYRSHPDLARLLVPLTNATLEEPRMELFIRLAPPTPAVRGKTSLDSLLFPAFDDLPSAMTRFRCIWRPSDYQWGGQS